MIHRIRHWLAEHLYQLAGRIEPRRPDLHEHVEGPEFVLVRTNPLRRTFADVTCGGPDGDGDTPAGHVGG